MSAQEGLFSRAGRGTSWWYEVIPNVIHMADWLLISSGYAVGPRGGSEFSRSDAFVTCSRITLKGHRRVKGK